MSNKSNVFLVVTIPTHLRVMMETADLLQQSGRFTPVMVYYPSAVFDQNYANCQQAPHESFVWTGLRFLSKADYLSGADRWLPNEMPQSWYPKMEPFRKLARSLGLIHKPDNLVSKKVRQLFYFAVSVLKFFVSTGVIIYSLSLSIITTFKSLIVQHKHQSAFINRNFLQRFLLRLFAVRWNSSVGHNSHHKIPFGKRLILFFSSSLFNRLSDQKRFFQEISELIQGQKPVLIVLPEANLFYDSQFVILSAHMNTTPVAIVPFTVVNTLEWAEAFFDIPQFQVKSGWNRLVAIAFPHWILEYKDRRLILPPTYVLGCEYFDIVPAVPWLINSGNSDVIAAESYFMSDYYLRAGIQKEKIHFTGALSDDRLFQLLKERDSHLSELGERFGIVIREKVILIGLPPNQFVDGKRQGCEFDSYEDLIRFIVGVVVSLSPDQVTVLINLHPRIKAADVVWLSALGANVIDEPIERLVPLVDVYVAVASATIRLGISCGIPVINYDAYQYNYDDYKGLAGVCEAKSKHDYESVVRALINDPLFYAKIHAAQKVTADNLCLLDGNAGERLLNLFDHITAHGDIA